ncbi:MAG: S-layer homology domain-containing protein [Oscillospiraceae bacterium]|nr:S-layer homology domain-containing protein [Oscillospiraceae bacterium]
MTEDLGTLIVDPVYNVIYAWGSDVLPDGVELPVDNNSYAVGAEYTVANGFDPVYTYDVYGNVNGTYVFNGWNDPNNGVMGDGDVTIVGTWTYADEEAATYTITYYLDGEQYGEVETYICGAPVTAKEVPTVVGYTVTGWTDEDGNAVTVVSTMPAENLEYYATSTIKTYTVTWVDEDGTVLEIDEDVPYGTVPTYDGPTLTKEADDHYTWEFARWAPEVVPVTKDATYTAVYGGYDNPYTVTIHFVDTEGNKLQGDVEAVYDYGTAYDCTENVPSAITYNGDNYAYVSADSELSGKITGDVEITVTYALDNWHDADPENPDDNDSETGGDGIPDSEQILIKYVSANESMGTVSPSFEIVTLDENSDAAADGSTAAAASGYTFTGWTCGDEISHDANLASAEMTDYTITGATGGSTYTFTAGFEVEYIPGTYTVTVNYVDENGETLKASSVVAVEEGNSYDYTDNTDVIPATIQVDDDNYVYVSVDGELSGTVTENVVITVTYALDNWHDGDPDDDNDPDDETGGDGVPDSQQVLVKYESADESKGTVSPSVEVLTITTDEETEVSSVSAEGSTATAASGYKFSKWSLTTEAEGESDAALTSAEIAEYTITGVSGGDVYTFTATFTAKSSGGGGSSSGGSSSTPTLNTEDHVAYIIGYETGYVMPSGNMTRAEVVTIFFRLLTDEARSTYWSQTNPYSDVANDAWYNNAISTLTNLGILDGDPDGKFRPNDPITRAEFVKIAVSFFELAEGTEFVYDGTFSDVDGSEWYADFVAEAVELSIVNGYEDGTFRPTSNILRAEACAIVNRVLGRTVDADHLLAESEMTVWPDNTDTTAWYYADIQEATNSHDYTTTTVDGEKVEQWESKIADRDWAALEKTWSTANSAPGGEVMD